MDRGISKLEPISDGDIRNIDSEYLVKHRIDQLFGSVLHDLLQQRPQDPVQYLIDTLSLGPDQAAQDPLTGLPEHRRARLEQVFAAIDKDASGGISLRKLQSYASKYGGEHLGGDDLAVIFRDFKPGNANGITLAEFLAFFAKVSRTMSNAGFQDMVAEMAR